jgi:hypothetical protein
MAHTTSKPMPIREGEKGYSWLFFYTGWPSIRGLIVTLLVIGMSGGFYLWYSHYGDDPTPNGTVGLGYAFAGITFLLCAALAYTLRRRLRKRNVGQLNRALNWHVFFALMGLALLLMHSFGNFNPRSGTYALCSMVALTMSGLLGRALDRFLARQMATEVQKTLTAEGGDRLESIAQEIQVLFMCKKQEAHSFTLRFPNHQHLALLEQLTVSRLLPEKKVNTPWDLAYMPLEKAPQERSRQERGDGFFSHAEYACPAHRGAPRVPELITALREVERAMRRERFYRSVIRSWRRLHIALAFLTLALTGWHVVYGMRFLYILFVH